MQKKHFSTFTRTVLSLTIASLLILEMPASAQVSLTGIVRDAKTGSPLAGANVVLKNTFLSAYTGQSGEFHIRSVPSGLQSVMVSFMGYQTYSTQLNLSKDTTLAISLGSTTILGEEVNIIATKAQPRTPATFSNISAGKIEEINLGKDLPYILQSTPSVLVTSDAGTGIGYTGISIRGSDLTRINVTMNGIPVNDAESQGVWFVDLPDIASSTGNIQVQRGVGTSTNGSGAFGASVNIQTQAL
ncbi:MAG TPA: TonB-dependent receptor, partial [Bacteroidales bacterium]|nr:TonB-dependent receptor [Bacteroidales bacterium]